MKNLSTFPDLGNSAKLLKISVSLEGVKDAGLIGAAIYKGLRDGQVKELVKMLREMHEDNPGLVGEILGKELLNDILTVKI